MLAKDAAIDNVDEQYLDLALKLARRGHGRTSPNPMVGAVVVSGGEVVGRGWHRERGATHAERMALEEAGEKARGATLYLTLEPCTHQGLTPPCLEAVMTSGVSRVVVAMEDPDERVDGRGIRSMREAAIGVTVGIRAAEARELIEEYYMHRKLKRPFVTYKAAASIDGRTAAADGTSKWITGDAARKDVHKMRSFSDAICVGVGTVLADDPSLTVREARIFKPPIRVIVDSRAKTPVDAAVVSREAPTLIYVSQSADGARVNSLEKAGAEVVRTESVTSVDLAGMLGDLARRGVLSLLLEGGATLAGGFASAGLIDKYVLYVAPKLLGGDGTAGVVEGWSAKTISDAAPLSIRTVKRLGEDLKIEGYVHRPD